MSEIDKRLPATNSVEFNKWFMQRYQYEQMYGGAHVKLDEQPFPPLAQSVISPKKQLLSAPDEATLCHVYKVRGVKEYHSKKIDRYGYLGMARLPEETEITSSKKLSAHKKKDNKIAPLRKRVEPNQFSCCYCEIPLDKFNYTRDHLAPISKGGETANINIRPCCSGCNSEKGNLSLREYIIRLNIVFVNIQPEHALFLLYKTKIANANKLAKEIKAV